MYLHDILTYIYLNDFLFQNREYSYQRVDNKDINVMLNSNDVSEYLKISADGLEVRLNTYSRTSL